MSASHSLSTRPAHGSKAFASGAFHKIAQKFLAIAKANRDIDITEAVTAAGYLSISLYTVSLLVHLALGY